MFQRETLIRKLLNKTAQNQYFYVKTELYPAVQCVKAKILLLLVGMFFVKHERWLPIFYDSKLRGSHKEVVLTHKKCHTLHKKMVVDKLPVFSSTQDFPCAPIWVHRLRWYMLSHDKPGLIFSPLQTYVYIYIYVYSCQETQMLSFLPLLKQSVDLENGAKNSSNNIIR